ncbi:MAG TPA: hypothetical protein ENL03_00460 [Phycisphaerae bacterium]|nr:hypothetical protein [Phycisphaerae bacterium]
MADRNAYAALACLSWLSWDRACLPELTQPPGNLPDDWLDIVNCPVTDEELSDLDNCVRRGVPFGNETWAKHFAAKHGLESTLRPKGRPRKHEM